MTDKKPSPISSEKVLILLDSINYLKTKLEEIRKVCEHDYEVLSYSDGHDGYSWVECEIIQWVHCKICGNTTHRHTGKFNKY